MKGDIESTELGSVEVEVDVNVEYEDGGPFPKGKETSLQAPGPDGVVGIQKPEPIIARRSRRKRVAVVNAEPAEAPVPKAVRKRKKPEAEAETSQVKRPGKRRRKIGT